MKIISEVKSKDIKDYEKLFEKHISYSFSKWVGSKYNQRPHSLVISFNPAIDSGMAVMKFKKVGKTQNGSSESIDMILTNKTWRGVA